MRKILALVLLLCLVTVTVFADKVDRTSADISSAVIKVADIGNPDNAVVMTAGGEKIRQDLFNSVYLRMLDSVYPYFAATASDSDAFLSQEVEKDVTVEEYLRKATVDYITEYVAIFNYAKELGFANEEAAEKYVSGKIAEIIEQLGGEEAYNEYLDSMRTSRAAIEKQLKWEYAIGEYRAAATAEGGEVYVNDDEARKLISEKYMKIQFMLISSEAGYAQDGTSVSPISKEEVDAVSAEIIAKLDSGEDFEKLMEEYLEYSGGYTGEPGMTPGSYCTFKDGEMIEEIESATKKLNPGEYTKEAVKTDFGNIIIKKYESTVEDSELDVYRSNLIYDKFTEIVKSRVEKTKVKVKEDKIIPYMKEYVNFILYPPQQEAE